MSLEREDIDRLKEIFVTRQECDTTMNTVENKINKSDVRLAVIEHRLSVISWLLMAVCGGIITTLIKLFVGG